MSFLSWTRRQKGKNREFLLKIVHLKVGDNGENHIKCTFEEIDESVTSFYNYLTFIKQISVLY